MRDFERKLRQQFDWIMKRLSALIFLPLMLGISFLGLPLVAFGNVFTVTNTDSSGAGSIRAAVLQANVLVGRDTVAFDIPGTGPHIIPTNFVTLGAIVLDSNLLVDGYTQPGAIAPHPTVFMDGSGTYAVAAFEIIQSRIEIRGLGFQHYLNSTIQFNSLILPNCRDIFIHDNVFLGGNAFDLSVKGFEFHNLAIVDNVFEGRGSLLHVELLNGPPNRLYGDSIRVTGNHVKVKGGNFDGIYVRVLGDENDYHELLNVLFEDNHIVADSASGNITGVNAWIIGGYKAYTNFSYLYVRNNEITGSRRPGDCGVWIHHWAPSFPVYNNSELKFDLLEITNNRFDSLGNGILIENTGNNGLSFMMVGGYIHSNTLSHCLGDGIKLQGSGQYGASGMYFEFVDSNTIFQNSGAGISIALDHAVGGMNGGNGSYGEWTFKHNHIYQNAFAGIQVYDIDSVFARLGWGVHDVSFSENSIHDNGGAGIAIDDNLAGMFDPCFLPVPVLDSVTGGPIPYTVHGSLGGEPNTDYLIEYFTNPDTIGYAEGKTFVGTSTITTNGWGYAPLSQQFPGVNLDSLFLTATATNLTTVNTGCFGNPVNGLATARDNAVLDHAPRLYPNPVRNGRAFVIASGIVEGIRVYGMDGKVVAAGWEVQGNQALLKLERLSAGLYLLEVTTAEGNFPLRLVVE
jgi:hypothetical protein